ncbi:hypothetical protein AB1Y20_010362 [Prymnesium parvum]|uniref:J domain-containing protein n=1 Tax=Prymnesium parvum TaxID=97485 RepID=A0AB34IQW2_PRYPA
MLAVWAVAAAALDESPCVSWRQTAGCSPTGAREPSFDAPCGSLVARGASGFCECRFGRGAAVDCDHPPFTCEESCAQLERDIQRRREARRDDDDAPFDADGSLAKLYTRGKGFYVMGNTELALRHFREALKLDPEHKQCKAEYKQAKKLAKLLEKIEQVMGKDVEGKGRQKALEREEQYEEARELLASALELLPPSVYRASLYRDLCICNTKTRRPEDALKVCKQHQNHDGSIASKLLLGEALLLNSEFEESVNVYREAVALDSHSQEARDGLEKAEKLLKRSKEVDYYNLLNVSRGATARELKRAYHKLAVEYHPDKNPDDREAAETRFKAVAQAYEVLSDEDLRKKYDAGEDVTGNPGDQQQQQQGGHWMHHGGQHVHVHFQ